jgi:hypothetical protein
MAGGQRTARNDRGRGRVLNTGVGQCRFIPIASGIPQFWTPTPISSVLRIPRRVILGSYPAYSDRLRHTPANPSEDTYADLLSITNSQTRNTGILSGIVPDVFRCHRLSYAQRRSDAHRRCFPGVAGYSVGCRSDALRDALAGVVLSSNIDMSLGCVPVGVLMSLGCSQTLRVSC